MTEQNQPLDNENVNPTPNDAAQAETNKAQVEAVNAQTANAKDESKTENTPVVAPVVIKQSGGKGLALGALVLALLGLGASGFLFVQGQNVLANQKLAFEQKMDKAALGESQNAGLLQDSLRKQNDLNALVAELAAAQKNNADEIARANQAYQELLKGRVNWLVDETEATLNLASQQLLLSGNVPVAITVLENIENRLARFEQADLLPIKQAISGDLAALKSRAYLDVSGTSLRLDRLETAIAGLPLTVDNTLQAKKEEVLPTQTAADLSWWQNAWQKAWASLQDLVEVRKLDNGDAMLLAPDQIYFVRENLRLRLLDARAALMQHNGEVYLSDLNGAEATVKQYFDPTSPATQSWLKELGDLKTLDVRMVSGDALKASLLAVRHYQDTLRPTQNVPQSNASGAASAAAPAMPSASSASAPAAAPASQPSEQKASEAAASKGERA
ncbi:MAG: uroporphyrinogen-III C-methyltransferase [Neisseria sp.]|nr:uroporphyrinogen-III C-methyltransferase [Neisseria sp.]